MSLFTRKRVLSLCLLLVLLLGGWLFWQRFEQVALESYVPETALGYLEVNDLPSVLDGITGTTAWQQLAPVYGLTNQLQYARWLSRLGRWAGIGTKETLLFARGQVAVIVKGIEVTGDEVRPRLALVIETHGSAASVRALMNDRLPQLAARVYPQAVQETSEYAGVPLLIYRSPQSERRLFSAGIGSTWLLANDAEALQACIDVRQGRVAAMAKNPLLSQARREVEAGDLFAFVSRAGASRLSQFMTHLLLGKALAGTPIAGLPEGLMGEVAQGTVEAMAYSTRFARGGVQDRYAVFCQPQAAESLRAAFRSAPDATVEKSPALQLVPAEALDVQLLKVDDPGAAVDGVERIVSAHLGAAQSFLFHKFFASARKTFLGLESGEQAAATVGGEVVRFSVPALGEEKDADATDRVWIVAARNRAKLSQWAERLLQQQGGGSGRLKHQGIELTSARDGKRAFAWLGDYLVLSKPEHVMRLIEAHGKTPTWLAAPSFTALQWPEPATKGVLYGFGSVKTDAENLMQIAARRLKGNPQADAAPLLEQLPWSVTITTLTERGLYRIAHSPVGNIPLAASFVDVIF